jgi:WD40 repeat protein
VMVRSVSCGKEVASLAAHAGEVWSVAFSPEGQHLVNFLFLEVGTAGEGVVGNLLF